MDDARLEAIRTEVARRHKVLLGDNDPILVTATLNELLLRGHLDELQKHLERCQDETTSGLQQLLEESQIGRAWSPAPPSTSPPSCAKRPNRPQKRPRPNSTSCWGQSYSATKTPPPEPRPRRHTCGPPCTSRGAWPCSASVACSLLS